jgi:penicillin-binding protein 1A
MLLLLGFSAFLFGVLTSVSAQISGLNPFAQKPLYQNTTIYANDGHTVLAILHGSQTRVVVTSGDISPLYKQSIVAIEDKRFYDHRGVDIHGILRAFYNDVTGGPVQGGSTITQQFVKNAINGNAPTITRKLK